MNVPWNLVKSGLPAALAVLSAAASAPAQGVPAEPAARVLLTADDKAGLATCLVDGKQAFVYRFGEDVDLPHYLLYSPSGKLLTVDYPKPPQKYPHHRGVWFADTVQLDKGRKVSFYNAYYSRIDKNDPRSPFNDRVRHLSMTVDDRGRDTADATFKLLWEMDRKTPVLDEVRKMHIAALGGGEYLLDVTFTVTASYGDVAFVSDAVHYAWPYVRMTPAFSVDQGGTLISSEGGVNQKATDGKVARWIDYSNTVEGRAEGLAFFSHSDNDHPHKWLTRDYGTFGPRRNDAKSGKPFTLKKGESLSRRVGLLVHNGDVKAARVAERYREYVGTSSEATKTTPSASPGGPLRRIVVDAGKYERIDTPVCAALEGEAKGLADGKFRLEEIVGDKRSPVPSQVEPGNPPRLWWILSGTTPSGGTRTFELSGGEPVEADGVTVRKDDKVAEVSVGPVKALRYHHAPVPPPPGADPKYTRSGFIHPVWSPAGAELTGIHPKDHLHHLGLWNPWTSTTFEGRHVDFWNLKEGQGTVRFVKFISLGGGPVFGGFRVAQDHVDLKAPGGEKTALNEELDVRIWRAGKTGWLCDYVTAQRCASSSPLVLEAYRYGGLGFRGTAQWNKDNSDYLTSEGKTRKDGHGTRSRWCSISGQTDKGPAGILFLSHPGNREHPEPMRIWPQGEIFFNYCPIQKTPWTLEPGNTYVLRYRLFVHDGLLKPQDAERIWRDFAEPPQARMVASPG